MRSPQCRVGRFLSTSCGSDQARRLFRRGHIRRVDLDVLREEVIRVYRSTEPDVPERIAAD